MYVKLPASQWSVLEGFHCISGSSKIVIRDHNKATMLASCIECANISIVLHMHDMRTKFKHSIKNNARANIHGKGEVNTNKKERKKAKHKPQKGSSTRSLQHYYLYF